MEKGGGWSANGEEGDKRGAHCSSPQMTATHWDLLDRAAKGRVHGEAE